MPEPREAGEFAVFQFFPDNTWEELISAASTEVAVQIAFNLTRSVGAKLGTTRRVTITDAENFIVFEWLFGKGVVFPPVTQTETPA